MLSLKASTKLYLATAPVDMRKAVNGLSALVSTGLCQDPQSGHLFIFYNRARNKIKCLYWDKNGFILYYKRLEKGKFKLPRSVSSDCILMTIAELQWLLAGLDFIALRHQPHLQFKQLY
jgi:transposase